MKAIILAAGYGTRLYPLTKNTPKALLPVRNKPVIEYILERLAKIEINQILIITNDRHYKKFIQWLNNYIPPHPLKIINDGTRNEKQRLGAIGDLIFAIDKEKINDDVLVFACDTIFTFTLHQFLFSINSKNEENWLMLHNIRDRKLASNYGVAKINEIGQIIQYKEKPKEPFSSLVSIGIYYFPESKFQLVRKFLKTENKDAPGYYIEWLLKNDRIFGMVQRRGDWIDIGNIKQYKKASRLLKEEE
jgi:glucose-1-phosphate thymidylyltransferase